MTLMLSLTSFGQKQKKVASFDMSTPYSEVKSNYKMGFFVTESLTRKDGSVITVGDELKLGQSASKISNQYESILVGSINYIATSAISGSAIAYASTSLQGNTYVVSKIKCNRAKGQVGFRVELVNSESTAALGIMKTITGSIISFQKGELINPNAPMSSDEALAELKKAKDKLELGLITNEEFNVLRTKLAKLIK